MFELEIRNLIALTLWFLLAVEIILIRRISVASAHPALPESGAGP